MLTRILCLSLLLITNAFAVNPTVSSPDVTCQGYPSLETAAIAALDKSKSLSETIEYAGVIYAYNGSYCFTQPVSSGSDHDFAVRARFPGKLAGLYHTHPRADRSELFSARDVETANALGLPSYIAVIATAEIRSFDPTRDHYAKVNRGFTPVTAVGSLVASLK
jgi:hypothetical protein